MAGARCNELLATNLTFGEPSKVSNAYLDWKEMTGHYLGVSVKLVTYAEAHWYSKCWPTQHLDIGSGWNKTIVLAGNCKMDRVGRFRAAQGSSLHVLRRHANMGDRKTFLLGLLNIH